MLRNVLLSISAIVLLEVVPLVAAHGHDEDSNMEVGQESASAENAVVPETYFNLSTHTGTMIAHIALMTIAWVFVLPIAVMLSIVRSRFTLPVQLLFLVFNSVGVLLSIIYNSQTPDLYKNNAHHKIGWIATWVVLAQVTMGLVFLYTGRSKETTGTRYEQAAFLPVSTENIEERNRSESMGMSHEYRWSRDSGVGAEPTSASLRRSDSFPPSVEFSSLQAEDFRRAYHEDEDGEEDEKTGETKPRLLRNTALDRFLSKHIPGILSGGLLKTTEIFYELVDRTSLLFGFIAILSGVATYGGFFKGSEVFNGLAHWIKGGIFFWYGLLTLGRWMGCFANFGWAWNVNPSKGVVGWRAKVPSAEFTESFVIWLYGCINVWLEHLTAWGAAWSSMDLEHVSIAILFFGGGLCGMFLESTKIRDLLNTSILAHSNSAINAQVSVGGRGAIKTHQDIHPPSTYSVSMNPFPALIIMLLGSMMGDHSQDMMLSSMVHKKWGTMLMIFGLARIATYALTYLSPPTSMLPSRPPTEVIASFGLISGGVIFMLSSRATVQAFSHYDLDAMFVTVIALGLTAFLMAWMLTVMAIKGWAYRKESKPLHMVSSFAA